MQIKYKSGLWVVKGFGGLLRSHYTYEGYETNQSRRECNDEVTHRRSSWDHVLFTKQENNMVMFIITAESSDFSLVYQCIPLPNFFFYIVHQFRNELISSALCKSILPCLHQHCVEYTASHNCSDI